jgi:hypothetical protein
LKNVWLKISRGDLAKMQRALPTMTNFDLKAKRRTKSS